MGRQIEREYRCGDWWLQLHGTSYYAIRYLRETRSTERRSLRTAKPDVAKRLLVELHRRCIDPSVQGGRSESLKDALYVFYDEHARHLASAEGARNAIERWIDYWGDASVSDLSMARQEQFHEFLRGRGCKASSVLRVVSVGKSALKRAYKRRQIASLPQFVSVEIGETAPKGRPLNIEELQAVYHHAASHVRAFIEWALGTGARPEAVLELHSSQISFDDGLVDLLPVHREQIAKKYRPVVRLPEALAAPFHGYAVSYKGKRIQRIKTGLSKACDRANVEHCSSYSFRHTAARWMRQQGVSPWEASAQLGHSAGRQYAVTERYAAFSPDYLANAAAVLSNLVLLTRSRG